MDATGAIALGTLIGGLMTGAATALIIFFRGRSEIRINERRAEVIEYQSTIKEWKEIANQLREQNERRDLVIKQLQGAVAVLQAENSNCREDYAEVKTVAKFLYDHMSRLHAIVVGQGGSDPGPLPEMPKLHDRQERTAANTEFMVRQAEQSANLVKEADGAIHKPHGEQA